jgi:hypothetical protein
MCIKFCKISRQVTPKATRLGKSLGVSRSLDFAKDDPTCQGNVLGKQQRTSRATPALQSAELLSKWGRVENQMEDLTSTERTEERVQEDFEIDELLGRAGLGESQPAGGSNARKLRAPIRL